jgi:hypothetical protein
MIFFIVYKRESMMINFDIIGTLFALSILQFVKIVLTVLLLLAAVLFVFCRKERILCFLTGKPYDENSEDETGERRFCDRRNFKKKKSDRRRGERRSSRIKMA